MRVIDRLLNKNKFRQVSISCAAGSNESVLTKYPDGLTMEILKDVDYSEFGAMLKAERLLPPSYDRTPRRVQLGDFCGIPRVVLVFKSKTTDNERYVGICRYSVSYSKRINEPITVMETDWKMASVWRSFAERVVSSIENEKYRSINTNNRIELQD